MVTEKTLSIEEYLNNTKSYLKDIINVSKKLDTWKIHLIITISFFFFEDGNDEEREIHSESDNIKIMMNDEVDEFIEERFESLTKKIKISRNNQWKVVIFS